MKNDWILDYSHGSLFFLPGAAFSPPASSGELRKQKLTWSLHMHLSLWAQIHQQKEETLLTKEFEHKLEAITSWKINYGHSGVTPSKPDQKKDKNWKQNEQRSRQFPITGETDTRERVEASYYKSNKTKKNNSNNNPWGTNSELEQFIIYNVQCSIKNYKACKNKEAQPVFRRRGRSSQ